MFQYFKYLRIALAIILLGSPIISFVTDLIRQQQALLDGPLAHYSSYTFSLNRIVLAILLSVVLLFDVSFKNLGRRKIILRTLGVISLLVSLVGLVYLFLNHHWMGIYFSKKMVPLYIFQLAYISVSLIVIGKAFDKDWAEMSYEGKSNA